MEEDTEVLDWGHEDDEQTAQRGPDDAEDAVSLGGDEDDYYPYPASEQEATKTETQFSHSHSTPQVKRDSVVSRQSVAPQREADSPQLRRSQSLGKFTHALPPKPVVSVAPVHPSPAQASTLASSMIQRERRANGHGKPNSGGQHDALPPDWELRQARSGGGEHYYYNSRTHESTWTRPVSGKSSPAKDSASRGREGISPPSRSGDSPEQRTSRKEPKRSVDDLSYEDRHYRPAGSAPVVAESVVVSDQRAPRSPVQAAFAEPYEAGRAPSPRALPERRRTRSLSPLRRGYPNSARARRDPSPERDLEGRHGNYVSRLSPEPPSLHRHSRARGRQDRMDVDVSPRNTTLDREPANRRGPNDWSAPRTRSPPPHPRAPSPSGPRRFSRGSSPGSSQVSSIPVLPLAPRQKWPDRPDELRRTSPFRGYSDYSLVDSIPQRRGREADSIDVGYGYDTKRRRVDDQHEEPRSAMDVLPAHGLPARPQASFLPPAQDERPRKRIPLPPQSARFREARHAPAQEPLLLPTSTSDSGRRAYPDQPPRPLREDDVPMRYADVPTDTPFRRQGPPFIDETDFDMRSRPPPVRPAGPSRPGSRFDDLPMQGPRDYTREPMDIDRLDRPPNLTRSRGFDVAQGPPSAVYVDHTGDMLGDAPRGPRAMVREPFANTPTPRFETQGPPPLRTSWDMGSSSVPRGGQRLPPRTTPEVNLLKPFGPPPLKSVSGTNSIPIGNRKAPQPRGPDVVMSPQDRLLPASPFTAPRPGPGRGREYPPVPEPMRSPERIPAPIEDIHRSSVSSAGRPELAIEWPPSRPADDHATLSSRPRGNSYTERKDRGPRVSRFGPERPPSSTAPPPPEDTPRVWITREESERMLSTSKETKQPELTHKLPERPVRTESDLRHPNDAPSASISFNGNITRNDRQSITESVRPAETTPGPRRVMNGPPEPSGGRQSPVDVRPRDRRPSLEGRLSSSYNDHHVPAVPLSASLPPRPITQDVFLEPTPRPDNRDRRRDDVRRQDERSSWERPVNEPIRDESPGSAPKIHPDRARLLQTPPGSSQRQDEQTKTSKPVRIRRPPPMAKLPDNPSLPEKPSPEVAFRRVDDHTRPDPLRRTGSSLLDRLSLDDPVPHMSGPSPSLRERMDVFGKGPSAQDDGGYGDVLDDSEMGQGESSRKGGRKRAPRPKRGRRSGMPA